MGVVLGCVRSAQFRAIHLVATMPLPVCCRSQAQSQVDPRLGSGVEVDIILKKSCRLFVFPSLLRSSGCQISVDLGQKWHFGRRTSLLSRWTYLKQRRQHSFNHILTYSQHYHPFCWILDLMTMLIFLILVSSYFKYIRGCLQYKSLQDGGVDGPTGDVYRKSNNTNS